jgi:hypothetical protein
MKELELVECESWDNGASVGYFLASPAPRLAARLCSTLVRRKSVH